ncbi:MAG: DUF6519 domain-containing protein [Acidobacteriota bacterium]|nr:DUF6519 domain-containing protein [Acidobacteriota bacterium]
MKGDFSRDSFDARKRYTRVLMQQGRVQLDADWNEQADTVLHLLRTLAADIFGAHGGPATDLGFRVVEKPHPSRAAEIVDLLIGPGHYYVAGILCENDRDPDPRPGDGVTYYEQPYFPLSTQQLKDRFKIPDPAVAPFIVYLDVWERLVTSIEDPSLREVALGGPDTATRTQVVWQVRLLPLGSSTQLAEVTCENVQNTQAWQEGLVIPARRRGRLRAKAQEPRPADIGDPCNVSPDARFRGRENRLYRVEIHEGGDAATATFKWSGDNGSAAYPVVNVGGRTVTLAHLGRDARSGLRTGDWVELVDDHYELLQEALPLHQVEEVDAVGMRVILKTAPDAAVGRDASLHPLLRRWDHREGDPRTGGLRLRDGAAVVVEQEGDAAGWLALEDGIQIKFEPGATYRRRDYWLIEARTATGDINWPRAAHDQPAALPPHGVEHHYAPLANIYNAAASLTAPASIALFDLRHSLAPAACRDDSGCPVVLITGGDLDSNGVHHFHSDIRGNFNPPSPPGPAFQWTVTNGTIQGAANGASVQVAPAAGNDPIIVKLRVDNFPTHCRNMATFVVQRGD